MRMLDCFLHFIIINRIFLQKGINLFHNYNFDFLNYKLKTKKCIKLTDKIFEIMSFYRLGW